MMQNERVEQAKRIATGGLSFSIILDSRLFPPLDIINAFFRCGYDDAHDEGTLQWEPFALSHTEYDQLFGWWKAIHPDAKPDRLHTSVDDFSAWFTRAVEVIESHSA